MLTDYGARMQENCRKAFAGHEVIYADPSGRSWVMQKRHLGEGGPYWSTDLAVEVAVLQFDVLYVGGDIDFVIFGRNRSLPKPRVRWIGEHAGVEDYVAEKASIGTGHELVWRYDGAQARQDVEQYLSDTERDNPPLVAAIKNDLAKADYDDQESVAAAIYDNDPDWVVESRFGMQVAPRVFNAHAALARLCEIWHAEEAAAPKEHVG